MHKTKVDDQDLTFSNSLLVRVAERLHRQTPEHRTQTALAAKARLDGKHPRANDAAIVHWAVMQKMFQ